MSSTDDRGAARFTVNPTAESHFSWIRTRLSSERTLMSYSRTSIALIGFGFTLYQFLAKMNIGSPTLAKYGNAPQHLSLGLIGLGMLFLVVGAWNYVSFVNYMHVPTYQPIAGIDNKRWHGGTLASVVLLFICGAFAFIAVWEQV